MAEATTLAAPSDTQAQQLNQTLGKMVDNLGTQNTALVTALTAILTAIES